MDKAPIDELPKKKSRFGGYWIQEDFTMGQGKYRGINLFEIPSDYFQWILNDEKVSKKLSEMETTAFSMLLTNRRKIKESRMARQVGEYTQTMDQLLDGEKLFDELPF